MRWRLLDRMTELSPGGFAGAESSTCFPDELFSDHFPSCPITPGVLLIEMGAQLAGLLVQASVLESERKWIFPMLGMVQDAKFRSPVPPCKTVRIRAELEACRPDGALCLAQVFHSERCCASMHLMLVFQNWGGAGPANTEVLREHARMEFERLQAPWKPPVSGL
jgi:3-hydroxyacyl-[acyl-carrier-protein] dehydratase